MGTPSYTPFWVFIVFPFCWYLMAAGPQLPLYCSLLLLCRSLTSKLYRNVFVPLPVPVATFTCFVFPFDSLALNAFIAMRTVVGWAECHGTNCLLLTVRCSRYNRYHFIVLFRPHVVVRGLFGKEGLISSKI